MTMPTVDREVRQDVADVLAGADSRAAHVVLADRERIDEGRRVGRYAVGHGPGHRLGNHHALREAALGAGVLADHADSAIREQDRHARHPRADRQLVAAVGSVADHLAHELVAEHDVAVLVVHQADVRSGGGYGVVMIHEVDVRSTDRGAHDPEEELAGAGNGVCDLLDLQATLSQHDCAHRSPMFLAPAPTSPASSGNTLAERLPSRTFSCGCAGAERLVRDEGA